MAINYGNWNYGTGRRKSSVARVFIKSGKGDIIVNQHRYRFKDDTPLGSYNWDWIFTPTGRQIKLYKKED